MAHDKIAIRLAIILQRLNSGESLCIDELCEEFEISKRTLQRDFKDRLAFLPIELIDGSYTLASYCLGKLGFNDLRDALTKSGAKDLYPSLNDAFMVDLLNPRITKAFEVDNSSIQKIDHKEQEFLKLNKAILSHQQISLIYNDKERLLDPYKLKNIHNVWYLVAVENSVVKNFTFTKIKNLKLLDKYFTSDSSIEKLIEKNSTTWVTQNSFKVALEIDNTIKEYFIRRELLKQQKITEEKQDSFLLEFEASYDEEVLGLVRYWMPHITILSPSNLHKRFLSDLKQFIKKIDKG